MEWVCCRKDVRLFSPSNQRMSALCASKQAQVSLNTTAWCVYLPGGLVTGVDCREALAPADRFGCVWSDGQWHGGDGCGIHTARGTVSSLLGPDKSRVNNVSAPEDKLRCNFSVLFVFFYDFLWFDLFDSLFPTWTHLINNHQQFKQGYLINGSKKQHTRTGYKMK